jgi:hypothetical protein
MESEAQLLKRTLEECPAGLAGWKQWEDACVSTLTFLFVPSLSEPHIQPRSHSGIDRRDAVFPNRHLDDPTNWGRLYKELGARMILFEFKNYDKQEIGKEETVLTAAYLKELWGRLAIVCCNKLPNRAAHLKRNSIFNEDKKVILFLTKEQLIEMLFVKERGEDPSDLVMDLLERFYLQHE